MRGDRERRRSSPRGRRRRRARSLPPPRADAAAPARSAAWRAGSPIIAGADVLRVRDDLRPSRRARGGARAASGPSGLARSRARRCADAGEAPSAFDGSPGLRAHRGQLSPPHGRSASPRRRDLAVPREGDAQRAASPRGASARPLRGATTPGPRGRTVLGMARAIEALGLTKRFGAHAAVDDLTFTVPAGYVTGFVGPNGAGKSTTMRMILGLDAPDAGRALVNGRRYARAASAAARGRRAARRRRRRTRAGVRPTTCSGSRAATAFRVAVSTRSSSWSASPTWRAGVRAASRSGMAQRLGIAAALLGDPPVLIFDEPVNGLDPDGIRWIRGFLRSLAAEGRAVLVSSHLMSELEDTADRARRDRPRPADRRDRRRRAPRVAVGTIASRCARPRLARSWTCSPAPARR